jgi:predicted dehydrogenase
MSKMSRREFLTRGAAGVAVTTAFAKPVFSTPKARVIGANDTINMAIIGIRGRGGSLIQNFARMKNVRLKYLVDADENLFEQRQNSIEKMAGYRPQTEWDMRKVLDDPEIDAVGIAAPNHWHALATIWACQAGKHVYVEKPACHNVFEGRKMVEASRKYNVLVQVGFQNRSRQNAKAAMKFLHDGKLGKIYMARGLCFKPRGDIGRYPDGPMKTGEQYALTLDTRRYEPAYTDAYLSKVHYDMWLGPAPKRPFNRNRFHYNWHWHWDYGNGDTGNQGPHQFDIARWGLNKNEYPIKIRSFGGYFVYDSSQETPNTQTSIFEYADGTILEFGTRGLETNPEGILSQTPVQNQAGKLSLKNNYRPVDIGDLFFGSEGWMQIDSGGNWQTFMGRRNEPGPSSDSSGDSEYNPMDLTGGGDEGHFENFISSLRSGKREDLNCEVEVGFLSSTLPLLANVSYRLGREVMFDGSTENFVGDKEADAMLTREYRAPYVVPQNV